MTVFEKTARRTVTCPLCDLASGALTAGQVSSLDSPSDEDVERSPTPRIGRPNAVQLSGQGSSQQAGEVALAHYL